MISQPKIFFEKKKNGKICYPWNICVYKSLSQTQNWKFLSKDGVKCTSATQLLTGLGNAHINIPQQMEQKLFINKKQPKSKF